MMDGEEVEVIQQQPIAGDDELDISHNHDASINRTGDDGLASDTSVRCSPPLHRIPRSLSDAELSGHSSSDTLRRRRRAITTPLHQALPRPKRREPKDNGLLLEEEEGSLEER